MSLKKILLAILERLAAKEEANDKAVKEKTEALSHFVRQSTEADKNLYVYSLYDKAADYCHPLVSTPSDPGRMLAECRRAAMSGDIRYPGDIQLLLIGAFNDGTGKLTALDEPILVGDLSLPEGFERKEKKENVQVSESE